MPWSQNPITVEALSLSRPCPPELPKEFAVTDNSELALVADADGAQVYICQAGAMGAAPA
jgi:hypothetical protein